VTGISTGLGAAEADFHAVSSEKKN